MGAYVCARATIGGCNQGLSSGEIRVHWDVGVLIQVHMSGNTSKLLLWQCVNSLDLVRGKTGEASGSIIICKNVSLASL